MSRLLPVLAAILFVLVPAHAQYRSTADSIAVAQPAFRASQLIAPGALLASGVAIHCFAHDSWDRQVNDAFSDWRGGSSGTEADGWLQLLPYAADLGLALTGVPAENSFLDRTVECVISVAALTLITGTMKQFIESPRPIGDSRSFPSGHTGRVFTGAELVRMEYGWGWGAGAYAVAAAVGVMRMYNGAHWLSDVLAGAGIGILSAHIGRWLLDPAKRLFGIPDTQWGSGRRKDRPAPTAGVVSSVDPYSGALCMGLALRF